MGIVEQVTMRGLRSADQLIGCSGWLFRVDCCRFGPCLLSDAWPHRLAVRTGGSQPLNRGSIPRGATINRNPGSFGNLGFCF